MQQVPSNVLSIRSLGLSCAGGASRAEVEECYANEDAPYGSHEDFLDSAFDDLTCAFRDTTTLSTFEERCLEMCSEAWDDCFSEEKPKEAVTAIVLLPESDKLTAMPKKRVVDYSVQIHDLLLSKAAADAVNVTDWRFCNQSQASLAKALQLAFQNGTQDYILIGADSFCDRNRLAAASKEGMLFSAKDKWGFVPGEAAGALWLTPNLMSGPVIFGAGYSLEEITERHDGNTDHAALSIAIQTACESIPKASANAWVSDANNGRYKINEYLFASHRAADFWLQDDYETIHAPSIFGECGTAYGFIAIMISLQKSSQSQCIISASSPIGHRGAILLQTE